MRVIIRSITSTKAKETIGSLRYEDAAVFSTSEPSYDG